MEKLLLSTLLFISAVTGQRLDGGGYRRPPPPGVPDGIPGPPDQLQERAYLDYDYDAGRDQGPPTQYLDEAPGNSPTRTRQRLSNPNALIRQGPPLQGLVNFGDETNCRPRYRSLPHETYCDVYYEQMSCTNGDSREEGKAIMRACPNGLVYTGNGRSGLIGVCDYPHRADCVGQQRHNPPQATEHCDWLYGIFGHETSCTRYWTCWNGTATEQFCIGGLLYNEETHACDWPQNVLGCQKHPLCKDDANGNVPLGKSCNRYWACQGGYPRLQRCPAMLVFDKERKRCVSPPTKDCDIPVTPPPDKEGDGEGGNNENRDRGGGGGRPRPIGGGGGGGENRRRFQAQPLGGGAGPRGAGGERPPPLPASFQLPEGVQPLNRPLN